jgi:glycosyltransferase involved in cell wall biosynthesis
VSVKVGFLGNMNNNHFAMARFLRDHGVAADVMSFETEMAHFHPSCDTFDLSFMEYCRTLEWGNPARWNQTSPETVRRDLEDYDILIGCGLAPAFCERIGRRLDIFVPYGGDLFAQTRFGLVSPHRLVPIWRAVRAQRRGIARSRVIHMDHANPAYEASWERLRGDSVRWRLGIPMVHTGTYTARVVAEAANRTHWAQEFARLRDESDLMILYHSRHVWGGAPDDVNDKGTDRLIRGLARFRERNPGVRANLVTLEFGADVARSRELVAALGLEESVHWLPRMFRKDLMGGVLHADVVCTQFEHDWLSSGVVNEALAMGRPILGYREDERYVEHYPRLYPMMNAKTSEAICARLEAYVEDPSGHRAMGEEGRKWYEEFVVRQSVGKYLGYIEDFARTGRGTAS